jgi:transcriptional regulator with XRE-family HTH domain
LNETLRRAMLRARLREVDVAAQLGVDPKTVRRWLSGRVPYPNSRVALAELVGADQDELWPEVDGPLSRLSRPEELAVAYPHRSAIPRDIWVRFFESAERQISVLSYSAPFLADDADLLGIIGDKAHHGVQVRFALGEPGCAAIAHRGPDKSVLDANATQVRNDLTLFRPLLKIENVEIRLHESILLNSIYRADDQLFVNQHVYGIPAARSPVFRYRKSESGDLVAAYINSFDTVWTSAKPVK